MSTNQTANYHLNQWAPEDPVLREEFNADNRKLDGALAELEKVIPVVKLGEWVVPETTNQFQMDLGDIHPGDYARLRFSVQGTGWTGEAGFRLNGVASGYRHIWTGNLNDESSTLLPIAYWNYCSGCAELYPMMNGTALYSRMVQALSETGITDGIGQGLMPSVPYDQIQTVQLVCKNTADTVGAGTKLVLYGLRY